MPIYVYVCEECGIAPHCVKPMAESGRTEPCPVCGNDMKKDFAASMPHVHSDSYGKPIHSDALAIHPEQRAEHQRLYPDVQLDREDRPILDSFGKHEKYMEKRGIHKPSGRNRRRMKKVS